MAVVLFSVFLAFISMATACTEYCACTDNMETGAVIVICNFPNSTTFLADLPTLQANVTELHLAGSLGTITTGMFSSLSFTKNLTRLMFWWLSKIDAVEPGAFKGIPNLKTLSFLATTLTTIPSGLLDGVAVLKELHFIDHKSLTSVENDVFSSDACVDMIEFSNNAIETIADDTFKNASSCLVTLNLDKNKIKEVSNATFTGLEELKTLSMSENNDMNISSGTFSNLKQVKSLTLDAVFVSETLPTGVFNGLETLQTISIQNGGLKTFKPEDFQSFTQTLEQLDISNNKIETFPASAVSVLTSLKRFRLTKNSAGNVLLIKPGDFSSLQTLTDLDMAGTKISQPVSEVFKGLASLKTLDLGRAGIKVITPGVFSGLQKLISLSLDENNLTTLANDGFKDLSSLKSLSLTNNNVSVVQDRAFDGLSNLDVLRLDYNSLTTLGVTCLQPVADAEVFLHDNPWNCLCSLDPLRTWIKENHNFTADVRCMTPASLKGKSLHTLTYDELCGTPPAKYVDVGLYVGITFLVLFLILIMTGALIFFYQKRRELMISRERLN
jgi:Leucine-rich repeat (LRR) protein